LNTSNRAHLHVYIVCWRPSAHMRLLGCGGDAALGPESDKDLAGSVITIDPRPKVTMPFHQRLDLRKPNPEVALIQLRMQPFDVLQPRP
jgi:hypothetical protein